MGRVEVGVEKVVSESVGYVRSEMARSRVGVQYPLRSPNVRDAGNGPKQAQVGPPICRVTPLQGLLSAGEGFEYCFIARTLST